MPPCRALKDGAPRPYTCTCQSSDVERCKVVVRFPPDPRQTVAALNAAGATLTQAAAPVVHFGLRDGPKEQSPHRWKRKKHRDHDGRNVQPHGPGHSAGTRHRDERLIGRRDEPSSERDPLRLVGIEECRRSLPVNDSGDLPREVHRVADAGVHPLPADRTVDMRGVAEEKRTTVAEPLGYAMVTR